MEFAGLSFVDAIEELARSIGVTVPQENSTQIQRQVAPDLYELMQAATRYYREQLKATPRAIDYLKNADSPAKLPLVLVLVMRPTPGKI